VHLLGDVDLVDDQQIGLGDAGAAFAGDFVAGGDVDHVEGEVGQFRAEGGGKVVAAGFHQHQFQVRVAALQVVDGRQVHGGVFTDCRVRAAAGFHAEDAVGIQGFVAQEEVGVFPGVDVVGDYGDVVVVPEGFAQLAQQRGFTGADGAADAYSQTMCHGSFSSIVIQLLKSREYWVSCNALPSANPGRMGPIS